MQRSGAPEPDNYIFSFNSTTAAKSEQAAVTDALRRAIELKKANNVAETTQITESSRNSTAVPYLTSSKDSYHTNLADDWLQDSRLKSDVDLHRSLLNSNPYLRKIFEQALKEKPDKISISQFSAQFWSTRLHLLRSHAVEKTQVPGAYNVLAEIKLKNVDGTTRLNLSKEQIQLIFDQHPLVKRVYNENVPKLSEMQFWARFFVSRLFKKLKGEKITEIDSTDPVLDKYLNQDNDTTHDLRLQNFHIPNFIDLEGNKQNHSQRQGNMPDLTMRPNSYEKVPILKVLNSMSDKIISHVAPSDIHAHAPAGMDEETFNEVRLRDLQSDITDNRVRLNIRREKDFYNGSSTKQSSQFSQSQPLKSLKSILDALQPTFSSEPAKIGLDLEIFTGIQEDSDSDEENNGDEKASLVGSQATFGKATVEILNAVRNRREVTDEIWANNFHNQASLLGLSQTLSDSLIITHSTTIEFLHYYWSVFLSGDPERAVEVAKLIETLEKSLDRINAVANEAEKNKNKQLEKLKEQREEYQHRTRKRKTVDFSGMKGGAEVVKELMAPTVRAIQTATTLYRKALEEQSAKPEVRPSVLKD